MMISKLLCSVHHGGVVLRTVLSILILTGFVPKHGWIAVNGQPAPIRINCGSGSYTLVLPSGEYQFWSGDTLEWIYGLSDTYTSNDRIQIKGTTSDELFSSERYFLGSGSGYKIPIPQAGRYIVRLYIAETFFNAADDRVFSILLQGNTIVPDLDLYATKGKNTAYIVSRIVNVLPNDLFVDIGFESIVDNAKINAIEIRYSSSLGTNPSPPTPAPIARVKAPIRINCGSTVFWTDPITKVVWSPDKYSVGGLAVGYNECDKNIEGTELDTLACSERFFTNPGGKYVIPVQPGLYAMRLLFVETVFSTPAAREFGVYVQGQPVNKKLDIIEFVGPNSAYIVSRSVSVGKNDSGIVIEFKTFIQNAKINAIEILDYNSRSGSSLESGSTLRTQYHRT